MWLGKSLVGDRPSWHKEPLHFLNKMLSIRKVRLLITSRYIAMQSYECVIISKMFLIYFISYGCNGGALVFLGGAEASASPSFALPMFITIKKIIILHLFLGVPAATVGGTGTPWHTRGYAPAWQWNLLGSQWDSQKPPGFHPKYLKLCLQFKKRFKKRTKLLRVWNDMGGKVINDKIFTLVWSKPLNLTQLNVWVFKASKRFKYFKWY